MDVESGEITELLRLIRKGDQQAEDRLIPLVYDQLTKLASHLLRAERPDHTLETEALVHEAFLRMLGGSALVDWQNRGHFFAVAARLMRRILVDHARAARARKRVGGLRKVSLESAMVYTEEQSGELLELDEALGRLALRDSRQCRIVEMRFFTGLTFEEIAEVLGVAVRTVHRDWKMARAWLYIELTKRLESDPGTLDPAQGTV
jgi:RNA polymerase sigma factor (TIGR02999 family)